MGGSDFSDGMQSVGAVEAPPNEAALRASLVEVSPAVRRFLFGMCGDWDQAEDLAQAALLKAWANRHKFDGRAKPATWIFTIARNHWYDRLRRQRTRPAHEHMHEQFAQPDPAPSPGAMVSRGELAQAVTAALGKLPDDQREALAMRESEGLTFRQIAEALGIPTATVKSRVRYALDKLANELKPFRQELGS